jgi:hypothetical protein
LGSVLLLLLLLLLLPQHELNFGEAAVWAM